jgi:hypothetical protein
MDATTVSLAVAAVGLVGALVGAGISTGTTYLLAVRKEAADKKRKRAEKLEELVGAVVEHFHWMAHMRYFYISGQGSQPTLSPITKIEAIVSTYFPEFTGLVRQFDSASNLYEMWIISIGRKRVRNEPGYETLVGQDEVVTNYTDKRAEFLAELKRFARREFQ